MRCFAALFALCLVAPAGADVTGCACDVAQPQTLEARECSLCRAAEAQPAEPAIFFLKDTNPRKSNRTLALPRFHGKAQHPLAAMTPEQRTMLWTAAIEKAKSLWGSEWGLAVNGDMARTQCHAHIHIGKLLPGNETVFFVVVDGPAQIPVPEDGTGLWVHPVGSKLHVHTAEQITETVLLR